MVCLVKEGKLVFVVVGVDGGNIYWYCCFFGGDLGVMVFDELLLMLILMGMDIFWVGFLGWLMGGYGVLFLGVWLGLVRIVGICVISLVLFMLFIGSIFGVFDSYDDYV